MHHSAHTVVDERAKLLATKITSGELASERTTTTGLSGTGAHMTTFSFSAEAAKAALNCDDAQLERAAKRVCEAINDHQVPMSLPGGNQRQFPVTMSLHTVRFYGRDAAGNCSFHFNDEHHQAFPLQKVLDGLSKAERKGAEAGV